MAGTIAKLLSLLLILSIGIYLVFVEHNRIVLKDQLIHWYIVYPWGKKTVDIKNLHSIHRLSSGTIRLECTDGKKLFISSEAMDFDSQMVWEYITRRAPENCTVLSAPSIIPPRFNRYTLFLVLSGIFFVLLTSNSIELKNILLPSVMETPLSGFMRPEPNAIFVNADGVIWSVDQPLFSKDYRITRYDHGETQSWDGLSLPPRNPEEMDEIGSQDSLTDPIVGIGADSSGNPVLIYRQQLVHLEGQTWQSTAINLEEVSVVKSYLDEKWFTFADEQLRRELWVVGQEMWFDNLSDGGLVRIDLNDGRETKYPLPQVENAEDRGWYSMYWMNGSVYVETRDSDGREIYQFHENLWQKLFQISGEWKFWEQFTVDAEENVWVLSDNNQGSFGKWSPDTQQLEWAAIEHPYFWDDYHVDRLGRIWAVTNIENWLTVFELNGDTYIPVRIYSQDNSNLPRINSDNFWFTADGMIWIYNDRYGMPKVYSLDTNQPVLPETASDFASKIVEWWGAYIGSPLYFVPVFVTMAGLVILSLSLKKDLS